MRSQGPPFLTHLGPYGEGTRQKGETRSPPGRGPPRHTKGLVTRELRVIHTGLGDVPAPRVGPTRGRREDRCVDPTPRTCAPQCEYSAVAPAWFTYKSETRLRGALSTLSREHSGDFRQQTGHRGFLHAPLLPTVAGRVAGTFVCGGFRGAAPGVGGRQAEAPGLRRSQKQPQAPGRPHCSPASPSRTAPHPAAWGVSGQHAGRGQLPARAWRLASDTRRWAPGQPGPRRGDLGAPPRSPSRVSLTPLPEGHGVEAASQPGGGLGGRFRA